MTDERKEPWLFAAALKAKTIFAAVGFALVMAFVFVFARRRGGDDAPVVPALPTRSAGELAQLRNEEARRRALEKRAEADAAAQAQAEHDAKLTTLADYVRSRKSPPVPTDPGAGPSTSG